MRFGWGRGFYTAIPVPKLDILNPPSTKVSIPAGAAYTFTITGLVNGYHGLATVLVQLYDSVEERWKDARGYRGDFVAFLSYANNTRLYNASDYSVTLIFMVSSVKVSYRVVTVRAGTIYVLPDYGFVAVSVGQGGGYGDLEVYDGTTWNYVGGTLLLFSNGENLRCNNSINTSGVNIVILTGELS